LRKCLKIDTLRKTLSSLPKTLDDTYARILLSIEEDYVEDARKVLAWLAYAKGSHRLEEVAEILAVDVTQRPAFDEGRRLPDPQDLLRICSSLVTTSRRTIQSDHTRLYQKSEVVEELRLAHASVKEFLLSERILRGPASSFGMSEISANTTIAEICLGYLMQFNNTHPVTDETCFKFPLALYAAQNWTHHAGFASQIRLQPTWNAMALDILDPKNGCLPNWLRLRDMKDVRAEKEPVMECDKPASPLYYASVYGFPSVVRSLLDQGEDINARGGLYGTALQAAASKLLKDREVELPRRGSWGSKTAKPSELHEEVVRILIARGADVNIQDGIWDTALQAAALENNQGMVELLLRHGARTDLEGGRFGSALQAAAQTGNMTIMQLLLQNGARVNAMSGKRGSALQVAALWGHEEVVKLLLSQEADVNLKSGEMGTALQAAAYNGNEQVVQLLLDHGAQVNDFGEGSHGLAKPPLYLAAKRGHEGVVRKLLASGAWPVGEALQAAAAEGDIKIARVLLEAGEIQGTPFASTISSTNTLQSAALGGNLALVHLLLSRGADVNHYGGEYGYAIHAAAWLGYHDIVQTLLEQGADANSPDGLFGSSLYLAALGGPKDVGTNQDWYRDMMIFINDCEEVLAKSSPTTGPPNAAIDGHFRALQCLLDYGAEVNIETGYYGHALQAASVKGYEPSVKLLLQHGAQVNACSGHFCTALQAACSGGHAAVVQLLLQQGADVNIRGGHYGTAIHAASAAGHETIVRLLLEMGADHNARTTVAMSEGGVKLTPLHLAGLSGNEAVVQILLDRGADINARDSYRGSVLHWAIRNGHEPVVLLLLAKGVEINGRTCFGETPLQEAVKGMHYLIRDLIVGRMEEVGIVVDQRDLDVELNTGAGPDGAVAICDACEEGIPFDEHFNHCDACGDAGYDICQDCRAKGALCPGGHESLRQCLFSEIYPTAM
jgi:ankyrin repeat protein